ncbi:MAG: tRNA (adenosine(37)-N6)-threonylcarbamoyltransferase complex ATPase subunit type 1 TsaE [Candidatus Paceibacterota bacterium]
MADLKAASRSILTEAASRTERPAVITLSGDLGAGKTTFVQELARELGVTESVTSPTFVIMKRYETAHVAFSSLIHIDAYRLEEASELSVLGFTEVLNETGAIVCIEWPEHVASLMPVDAIQLVFTFDGDERTLTVTYGNKN